MLDTWLTRTFDLRLPVVGAPMAGPGEARLAAAVSAAGGLGMVGRGRDPDGGAGSSSRRASLQPAARRTASD